MLCRNESEGVKIWPNFLNMTLYRNLLCWHLWWVSEFMFMENSCLKAIFSISRNQFSLYFYVMNSRSHKIHLIWREIMLKLTCFSLKITINGEKCHSQLSHFTQMMRSELTFTIDSRKFMQVHLVTNDPVFSPSIQYWWRSCNSLG